MTDLELLGDLAFSAEELNAASDVARDEFVRFGKADRFSETFSEIYANHINRILAEKLAKAPEVFGCEINGKSGKIMMWDSEPDIVNTHSARLVCIRTTKNSG